MVSMVAMVGVHSGGPVGGGVALGGAMGGAEAGVGAEVVGEGRAEGLAVQTDIRGCPGHLDTGTGHWGYLQARHH